jgi:hypothetical protein
MKLYATTTSERATKGQGGNKYLSIEVLDGDKNIQRKTVKLDIWIDRHDHTILKYEDCMGNMLYHDITLEKEELKGKRQKGDSEL